MKGRKRIPTKIYQLRGGEATSHRAKGYHADEPTPPEKMPPCPKHLDKMARKEWRRAGKILQTIGLMTELDMATLAGYCQAYSEWAAATLEVPKKGPVWIDKEGMPRMNPWLRVAREAFERMMKNAVLIGMSPSSRASLKVEKKKPAGKVESFMGRKNGANG